VNDPDHAIWFNDEATILEQHSHLSSWHGEKMSIFLPGRVLTIEMHERLHRAEERART